MRSDVAMHNALVVRKFQGLEQLTCVKPDVGSAEPGEQRPEVNVVDKLEDERGWPVLPETERSGPGRRRRIVPRDLHLLIVGGEGLGTYLVARDDIKKRNDVHPTA